MPILIAIMAIIQGIIMAINGNTNGHIWQYSWPYMASIMAIIIAINGNTNGHKWQ